jgi:hypothetical protein
MIILNEHTCLASPFIVCYILLSHLVYHRTYRTLAGLNNRVSIHVRMALSP